MLNKLIQCFLPAFIWLSTCNGQQVVTPDTLYGQLFRDVQLQKIFPDSKTFADCVPKRNVKDILNDYNKQKNNKQDLKNFVETNFNLPPAPPQLNYIQQEKDVSVHIKNMWSVLKRNADRRGNTGSLLPLPYPYIVPGGRFREIYYWDSYFTMLGLKESGEVKMMENLVKNFAYLINKYGHIPTGNRSYYLTRSQPPFFCMMVELLSSVKGSSVYKTYLPAMETEYNYWMQGATNLKKGDSYKHVTRLNDGTILNRYWDEQAKPRIENYKEDIDLAEASAKQLAMRIRMASPEALKKVLNDHKEAIYRNLRATVESGWDFSSRWLADEQNPATLQTIDLIPVDLNCLLYTLEMTISKAKKIAGNSTQANMYLQKAAKRKAAINKYCWSDEQQFFVDYNIALKKQQTIITAAGLFPLFINIASAEQSTAAEATTRAQLLKAGGIATTLHNTGQQWDAPNGWAPLQWIAIMGFENYGKTDLAKDIANRWLTLNEKVYAATGKLMEKYNVEDINKEGGGGEYPSQDGYGWTNGVYLALKKIYQTK